MKITLESLVSKLGANKKVVGLVKMMHPKDVVAVLSKDLGLHPDDARKVANSLTKAPIEGMASPAIETNKMYPVPSSIRRDNEDLDEDAGNFINNLGSLTPDMDPNMFPPEPLPDAEGWPYDDATVAYMDPNNKRGKRGHTS